MLKRNFKVRTTSQEQLGTESQAQLEIENPSPNGKSMTTGTDNQAHSEWKLKAQTRNQVGTEKQEKNGTENQSADGESRTW